MKRNVVLSLLALAWVSIGFSQPVLKKTVAPRQIQTKAVEYALQFNPNHVEGNHVYIEIPYHPSINQYASSGMFSFSVWFKPNMTATSWTWFIRKSVGSCKDDFALGFGNSSPQPNGLTTLVFGNARSCGGDQHYSANSALTVNTWHHVEFNWNISAGTALYFVDGILIQSFSGIGNTTSNNIVTYVLMNLGGTFRNLHLSDVVRHTSNFTPALTEVPDQRTIAFYPLNESSGRTVSDIGPHANHATIVGNAELFSRTNDSPGGGESSWNPSEGLVAYYPFNGNANDESDATITGIISGATLTSDRFGRSAHAFSFNGVDNMITFPATNLPFGNLPRTISAWAKLADSDVARAAYNSIVSYGTANTNMRSTLVLVQQRPGFVGHWNDLIAGSPIAGIGDWVHIVFTHDGSTSRLFFNGELCSFAAMNFNTVNSGSLNVGYSFGWHFAGEPFHGSLDDIRIYNRALSEAEVAALYQLESTPPNLSSDTWNIHATATLGSFSATATLGVSPDARDGFDETLDTPEAPIPSGDYVRAYFSHPEWNGLLTDSYLGDIKASTDISAVPKTWTLSVESSVAGAGTLVLDRPNGLPWPIVVFKGTQKWVSLAGDLTIPFSSDGINASTYTIHVGDTTAPTLLGGNILSGPAIWDNAVARLLKWSADDENHLDSVRVEFSSNNGLSWQHVYTGLAFEHSWTPPALRFNENTRFRLIAVDRALNETVWESEYPITIADRVQPVPVLSSWTLAGAPFSAVNQTNSIYSENFRFTWNGGRYDQTQQFESKKGYWIGAYRAGMDTLSGTIAETAQKIRLKSGWQLVSNPLLRTSFITSIMVSNLVSGTTVNFQTAIENGWITAPFAYEEGAYTVKSELMPFRGYWIGVLADSVSLQLPIERYPQQQQPKETQPVRQSIRILAKDGTVLQPFEVGTSGLNDVPAPPAAPNRPQLGLRGTKTILGDLYLNRAVTAETQVTTTLFTNGAPRIILLSWEDQSVAQMDFQLVFADGRQFDLTKAGSVAWNTADASPVIKSGPTSTSNEDDRTVPKSLILHQNYPNPFNPSTQIRFELPVASDVRLSIYNMVGQEIQTLSAGHKMAGSHTVNFNASKLSSGIYVIQLRAGNTTLTKKMTLLK